MSLLDALLLDPYKFHVWILVRTDGGTARKGSGTLADPYQVGDALTFDTLMNELPTDTIVHLGPATTASPFKTNGSADGVSGGWSPKKGMRIIGSGVDVTTLKLARMSPLAGLKFCLRVVSTKMSPPPGA